MLQLLRKFGGARVNSFGATVGFGVVTLVILDHVHTGGTRSTAVVGARAVRTRPVVPNTLGESIYRARARRFQCDALPGAQIDLLDAVHQVRISKVRCRAARAMRFGRLMCWAIVQLVRKFRGARVHTFGLMACFVVARLAIFDRVCPGYTPATYVLSPEKWEHIQ